MPKNTSHYLSDNGFVNTASEAVSIRNLESVEMIEEWLKENTIPSSKKYKDSSYVLKDILEKEFGQYLTNGAFIQACINVGLKIERIEGGSNAYIYADFINANPLKRLCKDHGFTYSQLAEQIGYGEEAISKAARTGEVSKPMAKALELFTENMTLREETKTLDDLKNIFQKVISRK